MRFTDDLGAPKQLLFEKKADADRYDAGARTDVARGQYIDPKAGKQTLRDYALSWLKAQTFDPSTRTAVELRLRCHVYPVLGNHELRVLAQRPSLVQAWVRGLQGGLAPNYVRTVFANLSTVLNAAMDDGLIARNPCRAKSVKPPAPDRSKVQPWTVERVEAVKGGLPKRYASTVDAGSGLGLRQGEVFGLSPDDVDWLRRIVHVRRQVKYLAGKLVFAPPKGGKERDVPLSDCVSLGLAAHLKEFPAVAVTLPWQEPDGKLITVQLMFTGRERTAINKNYFNSHLWKPALVAAGVIGDRDPGEHYEESREHGFHALRHFYASVLLADGVDIRALAEYLGHADPGFTLRTYCHLMPEAEDKARRAVDRALCQAPVDGSLVPRLFRAGA
ncbi:MAG TPA: tyrosine-type recombinase/integrase [Rugosimonospora sp.]|nr:tyrosine-type recombinase/integrase [Rugosimonospora sp.]